MMHLTIRARHAEVTPELRDAAEKKLARLERLLPRVDDAAIEVAHEETRAAADRYSVQVTVRSGPAILRAEERAADPRAALELAIDVLARQARRHRERIHDRHRSGAAKTPQEEALPLPPQAEDEDEDIEYVLGKIVRIKRFEAKPMSEEEALTQMELIGHDFFIFLDARTNDYALLYKRRNGDYGLLTPERG